MATSSVSDLPRLRPAPLEFLHFCQAPRSAGLSHPLLRGTTTPGHGPPPEGAAEATSGGSQRNLEEADGAEAGGGCSCRARGSPQYSMRRLPDRSAVATSSVSDLPRLRPAPLEFLRFVRRRVPPGLAAPSCGGPHSDHPTPAASSSSSPPADADADAAPPAPRSDRS